MTTLAADKPTSIKVVNREKRPLAANAKVFKNGLACALIGGANRGFCKQAATLDVGIIVGRFAEAVDNTGGANGDKSADVIFSRERTMQLFVNDTGTALVAADRESLCQTLDDQTVTGAASGPTAGIVYDVTTEGVWVEVDKADRPQRIQRGTATLAAGTVTITGVILTTTSSIELTMRDPGAGALTTFIALDAPVASRNATTGQFVVNAIDNAKATLATAVCTFDWVIVG